MKKNAINKIKVGDIFVNSWGYDQTNIDYYQVISKSKKTISIKKISGTLEETGFMSGNTMPEKNKFKSDKVLRKFPYEYEGDSCLKGNIYINFEYGCGKLWDGKAEGCSWYA